MQDDDIFSSDELKLAQVNPSWTVNELLQQRHMFFLKDLTTKLPVTSTDIKKHHRGLLDRQLDPYKIMGIRKVWTHWYLRMKTFAPYYRKHFISHQPLPEDLDANGVLSLKQGIFLLTEVAERLPTTSQSLRYLARQKPDAKRTMGVFRPKGRRGYLVDMKVFGPFFRELWQP